MLKIMAYVRYSSASINIDWQIFLGALIFFIHCGVLIFQNQIWEEEDFSRNKKGYKWNSSAFRQRNVINWNLRNIRKIIN
tara:strand:- start:14 stop:253 length:240 start_codon:yes stop_codon:yes gene_type:complete